MNKPILELISTSLQVIGKTIELYKGNEFVCTLLVCLEVSENLDDTKKFLPDLLVILVQHWNELPLSKENLLPEKDEKDEVVIYINNTKKLLKKLSEEVARGTAPEQLVGIFTAHAKPLIAYYQEMKKEYYNSI